MPVYLSLATETGVIMHMLGLEEVPDASDLLVGLGRVPVSQLMAREASSARLTKPSPRKRLLGTLAPSESAVPIRRPRRVPGGDPLDVSIHIDHPLLFDCYPELLFFQSAGLGTHVTR